MAAGTTDNGPPPSTLAAQLVEDISGTANSSVNDENGELRDLYPLIQRVKDDPSVLKSQDDWVDHNHMLVYVYFRVFPEKFKLEDPFLDKRKAHTEVLKGINFLRFTIKETPAVLVHRKHNGLLYRGSEPLWIWVFPHLLRLLGHERMIDLDGSIQGFFHYVLLTVAQQGNLRDTLPKILGYFQAISSDILAAIRSHEASPTFRDPTVALDLPTQDALSSTSGGREPVSRVRNTYRVDRMSQALRQVRSLSRIIAAVLLDHDATLGAVSSLMPVGPWLLDFWLDLFHVEIRWEALLNYSVFSLVENVLEILRESDTGALHVDIMRRKAATLLVLLCTELAFHPDLKSVSSSGDSFPMTYCSALIWIAHIAQKTPAIGRLALTQFMEKAFLLAEEVKTDPDRLDIWNCTKLLRLCIDPSWTNDEAFEQISPMRHVQLQVLLAELLPTLEKGSPVLSTSERELASRNYPPIVDAYCQHICAVLEADSLPDADRLISSQDFISGLAKGSDEQRCLALDLLSRAGCIGTCATQTTPPTLHNILSAECTVCDGSTPLRLSGTAPFLKDACSIFLELVRSVTLSESKRSRITAMIGLRRVVRHSTEAEFLDLGSSGAAQWCLQCMNSSIRELRIAAGRTLATFLQASRHQLPDQDVFESNMTNSIAFLRSTSEKNQDHLAESCISAWGQVGQVARENELNLVLIKLLEYLSSHNNIVSSFAFNELLKLAEARGTSARGLLAPYWPSLAYLTTKDMISNPQASRAVAELLQLSVNELLLLIQSYAIPWLVLDKRKAVIQKIAEARQESEIWRPLMDVTNQVATLSLLLMHDSGSEGALAKERLDEISHHFHPLTISSILQSEPLLVSMQLLKAAGDPDASRQSMAMHALETMANMLTDAKEQKRGNVVGKFLQKYVLGLMTWLTADIDYTAANFPPMLEQRRCIGAMKEMINICGPSARLARPQISAFLLAAFTQEGLRDSAFSCWAVMMQKFDQDDVDILLESTFASISQYWDSMSKNTRSIVIKMLQDILEQEGSDGFQKSIYFKLPKLSHIKELTRFCRELDQRLAPILPAERLTLFAERLKHENLTVVHLALKELLAFLSADLGGLSNPDSVLGSELVLPVLLRSLLDCASRFNEIDATIARLCTECIGLIGCPDFNQIETVREQRSFVVLHDFQDEGEIVRFVIFLISEVLVPSFLSATDPKLQGFQSFAIQELLERTGISAAVANTSVDDGKYRLWIGMPTATREVVTPFLTSRYKVGPMPPVKAEYPIFQPGKPYNNWIRSLVIDLLHKGQNEVAEAIFHPLRRVIRVKDVTTAEFLLPFLVLHVWIAPSSLVEDREQLVSEILEVLNYQPPPDARHYEKEDAKTFYQAVFRILDYAMRWIQSKRASGRLYSLEKEQISRVEKYLDRLPASLISQRAMICNEYARALFHLENYTQRMEQQKREPGERALLLGKLQDIYANIDEPDGLEGMSAQLHALDINQQVMGHRKAGRWTAAQTWYEMQLAEKPDDVDVRVDLLNCLRQAGQHDVLLNHVEAMQANGHSDQINRVIPFAVEAAWVTGHWDSLQKLAAAWYNKPTVDPNVSIAFVFKNLLENAPPEACAKHLQLIRDQIASEMSQSATVSLQAAHDLLLRCHLVTDLEIITAGVMDTTKRQDVLELLNRRVEMIGAHSVHKQYILGAQRAAMILTKPKYADPDISGLWLQSARLARKSGSVHQSFNAVLHASQMGDDAAAIENAKLLWRDNQHRKAIQMLQGAIERNKFMTQTGRSSSVGNTKMSKHQRLLTARAQLLLAKWLDAAGQTHASALREKYQQPPKTYPSWEKGHYYLGRHYKKVLEAEKTLRGDEQSDSYVTGEIARLVVENYVRSLNAGTKYLYQTLPRILTLWLDLGAQLEKGPSTKSNMSRELVRRRTEQLDLLHNFLDKYIDRIPAYMFYTGLAQIVARIAHPHAPVFDRLAKIICKVVIAHPRQALWSLIGIVTTKQQSDRKIRGTTILTMVRSANYKIEGCAEDLKSLLRSGEKLAEQLLLACQNGEFRGTKSVKASLRNDLRFNHKCAPCQLVVPVQSELTGTLPVNAVEVKSHRAFARDVVTIDSFLDEVLVLSSLARPRRLTARGSDGKNYMLLIKPKDDLRTDQRLMEFNGMISRSLKRDAESSRRQLYIRTYAVVPLNEECGVIEWVPRIKTMRDILLSLYASQKIQPDYNMLRQLMDEASKSESKVRIFTDDVLGRFPAILPTWFLQQFPSPSTWFAARLRYTRSCAVMSMVGTILGLGDRHGENVNLEEGTGGVFHVDFNCLFDKGLTFAKPEKVPFRLTHNMVAAMGIYGYDGPFRKSSELTLSILRQQEETLMSILEAFIHDPTLDLQKDKKAAKRGDTGVKLQPQSVVDNIKRKVKGLLPNESIPLGVEGQVEELIKQAVDPRNLTAMYIGWCPFL